MLEVPIDALRFDQLHAEDSLDELKQACLVAYALCRLLLIDAVTLANDVLVVQDVVALVADDAAGEELRGEARSQVGAAEPVGALLIDEESALSSRHS